MKKKAIIVIVVILLGFVALYILQKNKSNEDSEGNSFAKYIDVTAS